MIMENLNKLNGTGNLAIEDQLSRVESSPGKKMGEMASDFVSTASGHLKTSREYVVENPGKGIIIAAATGLVIGSLITMAIRSSNSKS